MPKTARSIVQRVAHTGPPAVQECSDAVFNAFRDMKTHTDSLVIDGNQVAQMSASRAPIWAGSSVCQRGDGRFS